MLLYCITSQYEGALVISIPIQVKTNVGFVCVTTRSYHLSIAERITFKSKQERWLFYGFGCEEGLNQLKSIGLRHVARYETY